MRNPIDFNEEILKMNKQHTEAENPPTPKEPIVGDCSEYVSSLEARVEALSEAIQGGITAHMPRDVAMDYESNVMAALTSLDCLLARLQSASRVASAARQFRAVFYLDDHVYGRRSAQTYEAMRALDRALEAFPTTGDAGALQDVPVAPPEEEK